MITGRRRDSPGRDPPVYSSASYRAAHAPPAQFCPNQRARRTGDRREAVRLARLIPALCRTHPVEYGDPVRAFDLFERHDALTARDASFAAVALNRGMDLVLSPDRAFDGVPGLRRLDPLDAEAVAAL